jgi:hypothetical protein
MVSNTDYIGIENVSKAIELSKLTKFTISRANANGHYTPIFDCLDSDSNTTAVDQFNEIAKILNPSIPYKITLFDFAEVLEDENGQTKIKKGRNNTKKNFFTFILSSSANIQSNSQQPNNFQGFDMASMRAELIKDISKQQEENIILKEITELKKRFAELDEEEEEEEEEQINGLGGIDKSQLAQIVGLINMFKPNNQPPTINGADENNQTTFKDNINKAIKTLYKHNKQLDTDLLKLSEIAENKPDTFNMLISTLRTM